MIRQGASIHISGYSRYIFLLVLMIVLAGIFWGYTKLNNQMIQTEQRAKTQWQQVNTQLARQWELIPKLVDIAKSYASHEQEVLKSLTDARQRYLYSSADKQPTAASEVDTAFAGMMLLFEQYPNLKADQTFRDLSFELAGTKNRIATERMRYNEIIGFYNTRLNQFPWKIVSLHRSALNYYTTPEEQLAEPEWNLK